MLSRVVWVVRVIRVAFRRRIDFLELVKVFTHYTGAPDDAVDTVTFRAGYGRLGVAVCHDRDALVSTADLNHSWANLVGDYAGTRFVRVSFAVLVPAYHFAFSHLFVVLPLWLSLLYHAPCLEQCFDVG